MNPLARYPKIRQWVYDGFWLIAIALGSLGVAFSAAQAQSPVWLSISNQVFVYVAVAVGYTASKNTSLAEFDVKPKRAA